MPATQAHTEVSCREPCPPCVPAGLCQAPSPHLLLPAGTQRGSPGDDGGTQPDTDAEAAVQQAGELPCERETAPAASSRAGVRDDKLLRGDGTAERPCAAAALKDNALLLRPVPVCRKEGPDRLHPQPCPDIH